MEEKEVMYKCPKCDYLINKKFYMMANPTDICPDCHTSIVYYELFIIDKSDKINKPIDMDSIMIAIGKIIEEEKTNRTIK